MKSVREWYEGFQHLQMEFETDDWFMFETCHAKGINSVLRIESIPGLDCMGKSFVHIYMLVVVYESINEKEEISLEGMID